MKKPNKFERDLLTYFLQNTDEFNEAIEALDWWNGYLGDDRYYEMYELDELIGEKKPSEMLKLVRNTNFDIYDDYFYFSIWGIESSSEKDYMDHLNICFINELCDAFDKIENNLSDLVKNKIKYIKAFDELQDHVILDYCESNPNFKSYNLDDYSESELLKLIHYEFNSSTNCGDFDDFCEWLEKDPRCLVDGEDIEYKNALFYILYIGSYERMGED